MNNLRTSCVELISSTHCEQRRREREISLIDLQTAVKHGYKEQTISSNGKIRFKFIYNNVVFITEVDKKTCVTCFALEMLPISSAVLDSSWLCQIEEQKRRVSSGTADITSHTVLVIDQSTSMNQGDIMGHRSRSRCIFYTVANEMIAAPLLRDMITFTDVVSMIEMRTESTLVEDIYMEPVTWKLHNKLVELASLENALRGKGHGNYIPAITKAFEILSQADNEKCALNLLFLSDGRPSDGNTWYVTESIMDTVRAMCHEFKNRLTFGAFGFAHDTGTQFEVLKQMVNVAKASGVQSMFADGIDNTNIRNALVTMTTSLLNTKSAMSSLAGGSLLRAPQNHKAKRTDMVKEDRREQSLERDFHSCEKTIYLISSFHRLRRTVAYKWEKRNKNIDFQPIGMMEPSAVGIAFKNEYIEHGAERVAHQMTEINAKGDPVGRPLVGKFSIHEEPSQLDFHKICARSQFEASRLAKKFNLTLAALKLEVPSITFLEPSFYEWYIDLSQRKIGALLAEKRLDTNKFKKWNDNKGGIDTLMAKVDPILDMVDFGCPINDEEGEDSESDSELGDVEADFDRSKIISEDVPQAFSHWTFQYTKGESLVCDLQGVLSSTYQLTDPAIHSLHRRYGNTDHGRNGHKAFFRTHKCNPLCETLRLMRIPVFKQTANNL